MSENLQKYHFRTRSGLEVDILLQTEHGVIGMEIKAREKVAPSDLHPMQSVAAQLGAEWKGGIVIYKGRTIAQIGEPDIWAVPSYRLFT